MNNRDSLPIISKNHFSRKYATILFKGEWPLFFPHCSITSNRAFLTIMNISWELSGEFVYCVWPSENLGLLTKCLHTKDNITLSVGATDLAHAVADQLTKKKWRLWVMDGPKAFHQQHVVDLNLTASPWPHRSVSGHPEPSSQRLQW